MADRLGVLFVCLGNICRSPTAQGVFESRLQRRPLADRLVVDSAGTGPWHVGEPPDERAQAAARARGYDLSAIRGRQVQAGDFDRFDYILAMDRSNLENLRRLQPPGWEGRLDLFLSFAPGADELEVPDPYYGAGDGFTRVLNLVEAACDGLLDHLEERFR